MGYNFIALTAMSYTPEEDDFESGEGDAQELEKQIKIRIANAVSAREITDDNPAMVTEYTALDQVILYEFPTDDLDELEDLRSEIIQMAIELENESSGFEVRTFNQSVINTRIAKAMLRGIVTDDNRSPWSGLTSLEQIICYECGRIDMDALKYLKRGVMGKALDLAGGCNMIESEDPFESFPIDIDN